MARVHGRRGAVALSAALLVLFSFTSLVSAHIVGKTIDTEPGGAALYGPSGFSGTITFSADEAGDTVKVVDYICVHTPGDAEFKTHGDSYTLTITNGGAPLATDTYTVTGGLMCTGTGPVGVGASEGATIVVPNDLTVEYTVSLAGTTAGADAQADFAAYNSIRNEAFDDQGGQARSASVPPPTDFIIPEAPLAILLVLTGGLAAAWLVVRQSRRSTFSAA